MPPTGLSLWLPSPSLKWFFGMDGIPKPMATPPISLVPTEILLDVFTYVLGDNLSARPQLRNLAQVCSRWSSIVLTSPQFWVEMDYSKPEREWSTTLRLSGQGPLHVNYSSKASFDILLGGSRLNVSQVSRLAEMERFRQAICRNITRWRRAIIHITATATSVPGHTGSMAEMLESCSAPILEELRLHVVYRGSWNPLQAQSMLLDLFHGVAPRLRSLSLNQLALKDWQSPIMMNLTSLSLENCAFPPTSKDLISALRGSSKRLTQLTIANLQWPEHYSSPVTTTGAPIILERLTHFTLRQRGTYLVSVLERIVMPEWTEVVLELQHWQGSSPTLVHKLLSGLIAHDRTPSSVPSAVPIEMKFEYEGRQSFSTSIKGSDPHYSFDLHIRNTYLTSVQELSAWCCDAYAIAINLQQGQNNASAVQVTTLLGSGDSITATNFTTLLRDFSSITYLKLVGWNPLDVNIFWRELAGTSDTPSLTLPELRLLSFRYNTGGSFRDLESLLDLVERRPEMIVWWHGSRKYGVARLDITGRIIKPEHTRRERADLMWDIFEG